MAFNAAGVFERLYNWVSDKDAGLPISAEKMDAEFDGIATALTAVKEDGGLTPAQAAEIAANTEKVGISVAQAAEIAANTAAIENTFSIFHTTDVSLPGIVLNHAETYTSDPIDIVGRHRDFRELDEYELVVSLEVLGGVDPASVHTTPTVTFNVSILGSDFSRFETSADVAVSGVGDSEYARIESIITDEDDRFAIDISRRGGNSGLVVSEIKAHAYFRPKTASTSDKGLIELATTTQGIAGLRDDLGMTPESTKAAIDAIPEAPDGNLLGLTDTPSAFGAVGQILKVNPFRTGMIFADEATGGGDGGGEGEALVYGVFSNDAGNLSLNTPVASKATIPLATVKAVSNASDFTLADNVITFNKAGRYMMRFGFGGIGPNGQSLRGELNFIDAASSFTNSFSVSCLIGNGYNSGAAMFITDVEVGDKVRLQYSRFSTASGQTIFLHDTSLTILQLPTSTGGTGGSDTSGEVASTIPVGPQILFRSAASAPANPTATYDSSGWSDLGGWATSPPSVVSSAHNVFMAFTVIGSPADGYPLTPWQIIETYGDQFVEYSATNDASFGHFPAVDTDRFVRWRYGTIPWGPWVAYKIQNPLEWKHNITVNSFWTSTDYPVNLNLLAENFDIAVINEIRFDIGQFVTIADVDQQPRATCVLPASQLRLVNNNSNIQEFGKTYLLTYREQRGAAIEAIDVSLLGDAYPDGQAFSMTFQQPFGQPESTSCQRIRIHGVGNRNQGTRLSIYTR